MTDQERKDAIRFFERVAEDEAMNYSRLAIEALKAQEPKDVLDTNVGDIIYRQAAIDALHMHLMYRMGTDSNKKRLDEWINNLPSVQSNSD